MRWLGLCLLGACGLGCAEADAGVDAAGGGSPDGRAGCVDADLSRDPLNCGACGAKCPQVFEHSQPTCSAGQCGYECAAGFSGPMCDHACPGGGGVDDPDDNFHDTNCDGIDGDVARAVFVAPDGDDAGPGTMAQPKKTLRAAIQAAMAQSPPKSVYIGDGEYFESVVVPDGVSLYGGYHRSLGWMRNDEPAIVHGEAIAMAAIDITRPTTIDHVTVLASDQTTAGRSSIGLLALRAHALTFRKGTLTAGAGAPGANGTDGVPGMRGFDGGRGGDGVENSGGFFCRHDAQPVPGAGGGSVCAGENHTG